MRGGYEYMEVGEGSPFLTRDSELAYVCRCGQQFTRGGGDGSDGERAYLAHIGYQDKAGNFGITFGGLRQLPSGCPSVTDLFAKRGKQALCWYGRHRAQIANMELNAHPDAEVRRLSAIVDQNTTTMLAFQQATDTINAIVAYIRSEMPEELGQPVDQIVVRLLQRYKKLLEATK